MDGFCITNGKKYLNNNMQLVKGQCTWKTEDAAKRFLENWKLSKRCTCTTKGTDYYVMGVGKCMAKEQERFVQDIQPENVPIVDNSRVSGLQYADAFQEDSFTLLQTVDNIMRCIETRKLKFREDQAEAEKEIIDLYHLIEILPAQNSVSGYRFYKLLRECLIKRRKCKDELALIEAALSSGWSGEFRNAACVKAQDLENREYRPRSQGEIAQLVSSMLSSKNSSTEQ